MVRHSDELLGTAGILAGARLDYSTTTGDTCNGAWDDGVYRFSNNVWTPVTAPGGPLSHLSVDYLGRPLLTGNVQLTGKDQQDR